jgi:hypothetical protein
MRKAVTFNRRKNIKSYTEKKLQNYTSKSAVQLLLLVTQSWVARQPKKEIKIGYNISVLHFVQRDIHDDTAKRLGCDRT